MCVARTPILVPYKGIHAEMQEIEQGSGGGFATKIFAIHALQIAGNTFSVLLTIPSLLEN